MTNNRVIRIPGGRDAIYKNAAGNEVSINMRPNREYAITLYGGEVIYATVIGINREKKPDGDSRLMLGLRINPGFMDVMVPVNGEEISLSKVCSIEEMHAKFTRDTRAYKKGGVSRPTTEGFTFSFNTSKFDTPYKITAYVGEFVSMGIANPESDKGRDIIYGTIEDIDENDNIVVTRYLIDRGVRSVESGYTFPAKSLLGIYRYKLEMEPYDPNAYKRYIKDGETKNEKE